MATYDWTLFRDQEEGLFKTHPMQVVRKAAGIAALVGKFSDTRNRPGAERWVYYNNPGTEEKLLCLRMVEATAQLTLLTDALTAVNNEDSRDPEGRLLHSDGLMKADAASDVVTIQGLMFDEYYEKMKNRIEDMEAVATIEIGDWFWVIVDGRVQFQVGEGDVAAAGDLLVMSADGTHSEGGRVMTADVTSIPESSQRKVVGAALEAGTEGDLIAGYISLRELGYRTTAVTHW